MYLYAIHYRDVYDEEKLAAASGAFIDLYTPFSWQEVHKVVTALTSAHVTKTNGWSWPTVLIHRSHPKAAVGDFRQLHSDPFDRCSRHSPPLV